MRGLFVFQKFVNGQANVFGNLSEQNRRDVCAGMKWHSGASSIRMAILFVRASLPNFFEAHRFKNGRHFARFSDGRLAHTQATAIF